MEIWIVKESGNVEQDFNAGDECDDRCPSRKKPYLARAEGHGGAVERCVIRGHDSVIRI
jgi:hypothetical protein